MPQSPTQPQYLVATFDDPDRAEEARRRAGEELGSDAVLESDLVRRGARRADQQEEAREMWGGIGAPPGTKIQYQAGMASLVVGGLIGMVALLPLAFVPFGVDFWWRVLIVLGSGAAGGSVAAASYWGGRAAQLAEDTPLADPGAVVGVRTTDADRARRLLEDVGAARVDVVDREGWPLETNVGHDLHADGRAAPTSAPSVDKE